MGRIELFSLNDRLQVGNYFCGCDSNSVLRVSLVSLGSKWNIFHRAKKNTIKEVFLGLYACIYGICLILCYKTGYFFPRG